MNKLILLILLALPIGFTACKTAPQVVAYKTEGVIITTADSALKAYSDYSQTHTPSRVEYDAVMNGWRKYYDAQQIAKFALETYLSAANEGTAEALQSAEANVSAASAAFIDLVKGFLK